MNICSKNNFDSCFLSRYEVKPECRFILSGFSLILHRFRTFTFQKIPGAGAPDEAVFSAIGFQKSGITIFYGY